MPTICLRASNVTASQRHISITACYQHINMAACQRHINMLYALENNIIDLELQDPLWKVGLGLRLALFRTYLTV